MNGEKKKRNTYNNITIKHDHHDVSTKVRHSNLSMSPPTANIGPSAGIRKSCLLNYPGPADTVLAHHGQ